jgi:membrane protein YdbS with pleckstrin-like domain
MATWLAILSAPSGLIWWLADIGTRGTLVLIGCVAVPMLAIGALLVILPPIHYRHGAWRVDDRGVELRWGAWWRSTSRVPRSRIQHTDVAQGPLERRYGLGRLIVHTAGMHHGELVIRGLDHARALALRDLLLARDDSADPV